MSQSFVDQLTQRIRFVESQRAAKVRDDLERTVKNAAPVGTPRPFQTHEPGMLRDSVSVAVRLLGDTFVFRVVAAAPHASFTRGTNAFSWVVARPVSPSGRAGAVRFFWTRTGNIEYRPTGWIINHPGVPRNTWWDDALAQFPAIVGAAG